MKQKERLSETSVTCKNFTKVGVMIFFSNVTSCNIQGICLPMKLWTAHDFASPHKGEMKTIYQKIH